ncbi:DUF402 domain-containing protein [bacterium]|nr:DUF402 domain-containing protein [bacterium]
MTQPAAQSLMVVKLNLQREETWRYEGHVLEWGESSVLVEARFNRDDLDFHGVLLRRGDRFVERYYTDRWYNIFAIHDLDDDRLKGWYCNVTRPAEITPGQIAYVDLALDLLVYPDGRSLVLDEDEFAALPIDDATRQTALTALSDLQALTTAGHLEGETNYS